MNNEEQENVRDEEKGPVRKEERLIRLIKSIVENPEKGDRVDERIVKYRYFNSFNYSVLGAAGKNLNLTLGITSAKRGEGKTLVACNLAVSLALGLQKKTVLVDLNFAKPQLHDVFELQNGPGLAEGFTNGSIHVSRTSVEHLFVLSAGVVPLFHDPTAPSTGDDGSFTRGSAKPLLSLDQLSSFRDVIYSLEQEFEFIIVDMPPVGADEIPVLFTNQLNGLLIVVDQGRTRKEDLDGMFQKINEGQVLGFVFNRLGDTE